MENALQADTNTRFSFDSGSASTFNVSLDFFTGPLDLLLHLVQRSEVSIEEVEMSKIADQYLQIIEKSECLDLELATEYLVVAATLVAIKSDSILPSETPEEGMEEDSAEFYEQLRERLRRYEQVKLQASALRDIPQLGVSTFARVDRKIAAPDPEDISVDDDPQTLGAMFVGLLRRIGATANSLRVWVEPISIVDFMMRTVDMLRVSEDEGRPRTFISLLRRFNVNGPAEGKETGDRSHDVLGESRGVVIGGFVAVLELVKRGVISAAQQSDQHEISLALELEDADSITEQIPTESELAEEEAAGLHDNVIPLMPREEPVAEEAAVEDSTAEEIRKEVNRE